MHHVQLQAQNSPHSSGERGDGAMDASATDRRHHYSFAFFRSMRALSIAFGVQ